MGLCYSLRPLLFGDREDVPRGAVEPLAQDPRPGLTPGLVPAAAAGPDAVGTLLPRSAGGSRAGARPRAEVKKERSGRPDQQRAEEREAERQARKVSRSIDRLLREQKRDLQQTHRLLLLDEMKVQVPEGQSVPGTVATLLTMREGKYYQVSPSLPHQKTRESIFAVEENANQDVNTCVIQYIPSQIMFLS